MHRKIQVSDNVSGSVWKKFLLGDANAFSEIYNTYSDVMFSYGVCFTDDLELVKDIIHDIFIKMYNNRALIETSNLKFYLLRAMKNEIYCMLRSKKETCRIEEDMPSFSPEYSVEDIYIENEHELSLKKDVMLLLNSLTSRQKEVIYYRYMEGLSINEIADMMDMNYQSVSNLIQRSMERLRKIYTDSPTLLQSGRGDDDTNVERKDHEGNEMSYQFRFLDRWADFIIRYISPLREIAQEI